MSLDRSLKQGAGLAKHRNVLSRAERIAKLNSQGKFDLEAGSPLGLPKVGNRKVVTGKASKKKDEAEGDAAAGAAAPAAAAKPAAKPAGGKK